MSVLGVGKNLSTCIGGGFNQSVNDFGGGEHGWHAGSRVSASANQIEPVNLLAFVVRSEVGALGNAWLQREPRTFHRVEAILEVEGRQHQ